MLRASFNTFVVTKGEYFMKNIKFYFLQLGFICLISTTLCNVAQAQDADPARSLYNQALAIESKYVGDIIPKPNMPLEYYDKGVGMYNNSTRYTLDQYRTEVNRDNSIYNQILSRLAGLHGGARYYKALDRHIDVMYVP